MVLRNRARPRSYRLGRRLAAGGMGEVYDAEAVDSGIPVAVKRMLEHAADDEDLLRLFIREAMVASTLEHHNVVEVIDVGHSGHEMFLVMELVDGPTLAEVLEVLRRRGERPPIQVACGIANQIAQGLAHAHERALPDGTPMGIVHRDIAPENVLIGMDGVPKLVDFGLAKLEGQSLTQPGVIRGRPRSLAPEQARGDDTDARADIFALGAILFELTSGDRLYPDEAIATLLWKVAAGDYASIRERMPDADPNLVAIIERAVAVSPDDRHRSARQFERELGGFQASRELRVSSAAIADLVSSTWDEVLQLRGEVLGDSAGELEGHTVSLLADRLADYDGTEDLTGVREVAEERPNTNDSAPPKRWKRPKRPPRPDGWDKVTPLPDAPARQLQIEDRVARAWWIAGAALALSTIVAFFVARALVLAAR